MSMTAPQRRSPRRSRSARPSVAEQAAEVFARHGYRGTTPELLAEALGLVADEMPSRADLFAQVLDRVRTTLVERWTAEPECSEDPETRLRQASQVFADVSASHASECAALHRALVEPVEEEIAASLQGLADEAVAWLANVVRQGQQNGLVRRSLDPAAAAWHLIATALGAVAVTALRAPLDSLPQALDCALNGILKTDV
jgi:TetR/AcrR family transcriptional regulator, transcriptional repressor for nem operon